MISRSALTFICSKGDPHPTDAGYRTENLLVMDTFVPGEFLSRSKYPVHVYEQLLSAAESTPGVITAPLESMAPRFRK